MEKSAMHRCPIYGCINTVAYEKLMCMRHWVMVPPAFRMKVYNHWNAGNPSDQYPAYRARAIAAVEALQDSKK